MDGKIFLVHNEKSAVKRKINTNDIVDFLNEIENSTKFGIFEMIKNIQANIAKSYSVSKENPKSSVFIYGRQTTISLKFRMHEKEAKILMPKDINILPKN